MGHLPDPQQGRKMSYAPESILNVRKLIQKHVPSLSNIELGIVGDDSHANSGTSYHLGADVLRSNAYSVNESRRDRHGLTNAASALDVGWFSIKTPEGTQTLRNFSKWLVEECATGANDTNDIREVIYSPDGNQVKRWDRLRIRFGGGDSHLTHTHISWFRDSEHRDKTSVIKRWFQHIGLIEKENMLTEADKTWIRSEINRVARVVWDHTEPDPVNPETERRTGGDIRMMDYRARTRQEETVTLLTEILTKLSDK